MTEPSALANLCEYSADFGPACLSRPSSDEAIRVSSGGLPGPYLSQSECSALPGQLCFFWNAW